MTYSIEITGLPELQKKLSPTEFQVAIKEGMTYAVVYLWGMVKQNTPHRTGQLQGAWTYQISADGTMAKIGNSKSYGEYVEFGTGIYGKYGKRIVPTTKKALSWDSGKFTFRSVSGMKGRFFVKQTLESERTNVITEFNKGITKMLNDKS